jgi:hypothetical protein
MTQPSPDDALDLGQIEPGEIQHWSSTWERLKRGEPITMDEAIAEYYRLERLESDALQRAYDIGEQRQEAAARARALGWRG